MSYSIIIPPSIHKKMVKWSHLERKWIYDKIDTLAFDARPNGCKKLKGYAKTNTYRIRHSKYRIVYRIEDKILTILITDVDHRKDVYRKN